MNKLYDQYNNSSNVTFLTIYVSEAHASDEWPIRTKAELTLKQPKTDKERINVANSFITNFGYKIPTVVDNINDDFTNSYSAWPFRAFMINGKTKEISWIMQPKNPGYYDWADIKAICKYYSKREV